MNILPPSIAGTLAVIPVLLGPLQVLLVALPALLMALGSILAALARPRYARAWLKLLWRQKLSLAAVVVLVFAVNYTAAICRKPGDTNGGIVAGRAAAGAWPMFRQNLKRTGTRPDDAAGPLTTDINWAWQQRAEAYLSSPAISGDRVYVASASLGIFNRRGRIYCFDRNTGSVIWQMAPDGYQPTFSSPSLEGNYLVIGEGVHISKNSRIVTLDLGTAPPQVAWTLRTRSHVECSPVIANGRVYIGAGDDGIYCVELAPDENGKPVQVWHAAGKNVPDAETALAVHGNRVYAGLGKGGEALCVLDADTGKEIKRIPTGYPVFTPPALYAGRLYIGMGNGDYINSASQRGLPPGGEVWCIDTRRLEKRWSYKTESTILAAISAVDEGLYVVTRAGRLLLLTHNGQLAASRDLATIALSSPAVTDEFVYQLTANGYLYALERGTLEPRWSVRIGRGSTCVSSPAVAGGRLYVGTGNDGFICLGSRTVEAQPEIWAGHLGGQGMAGNVRAGGLPETGNFRWQYPADQQGEDSSCMVKAPPASVANRLYVPLSEGRTGMACLEIAAPGDATPAPRWLFRTTNGVIRSPAATEESVFFTDTGNPEVPGHLYCVDARNGTLNWKKKLATGASGMLVLYPDKVIVQAGGEHLRAYDVSGKELWRRHIGRLAHPPSAWNHTALLSLDKGNVLKLLDAPTGRCLWESVLPHPARTPPIIHDGDVVVGTANGIEYRSIVNGALLATIGSDHGGCAGVIAVRGNRLFCLNARGTELLQVVNRQLTGVHPIPESHLNPLILNNRRALVMTVKGPVTVELTGDDTASRLWAETSWLGAACSPMVLHHDAVYMGMAGWGLVCLGGEP